MPMQVSVMTPPSDPAQVARALKVLLICTRDPRGRMSGRKMVLNTIVESLVGLGHEVTVAHFGAPEAQGGTSIGRAHRYLTLPNPSLTDRLSGGLRWMFTGAPSLNEALYRSRRARTALMDIAHNIKADVVITDMLRTAQYGHAFGLPWVADLDDLLSRRYETLAASYTAQSNLLGYHDTRVGRVLLGSVSWLMPWVLRREAASAHRREIEVARRADVTTLVSATEAVALTQSSGRKVHSAPMAVSGPTELPPLSGRSEDLVFLGGLDYGPNLRSVLQFDQQISPALAGIGLMDQKLHVIGHPAGKANLFSDAVVLDGYVDDLDTAVQSYRAMLVPEVLPGGIKTKIIVAALNGTLVLAHRTALDGMGLEHGKTILSWDSSDDLAQLLRKLRQGEFDVASITGAARIWAQDRYGPESLQQIWSEIIAKAFSHGRHL